MIINLTGKQNDLKTEPELVFNLPQLYFDRRFAYKVGLHIIHVEFDNEVTNPDMLCLNTNLVDRSSVNPTQTIGHLWTYARRGTCQYLRLTPVVYFPLHLFDLQNAKFQVTRQFVFSQVKIEKIFIQLEIVKVDPYGRLQ